MRGPLRVIAFGRDRVIPDVSGRRADKKRDGGRTSAWEGQVRGPRRAERRLVAVALSLGALLLSEILARPVARMIRGL